MSIHERDKWLENNLDQAKRFVECCELAGIQQDQNIIYQYLAAKKALKDYAVRTAQFMQRLEDI